MEQSEEWVGGLGGPNTRSISFGEGLDLEVQVIIDLTGKLILDSILEERVHPKPPDLVNTLLEV